jgi:hypothetical protein
MNQSLSYEISQVMPQALLTGLFVSLATVMVPASSQGATGNYTGPYTALPECTNIACMDAPPSMTRVQATEVKAVAEIMASGLRHVLLSICLTDAPNWAGNGYRVIVDGIEYDLLGAENDSQLTQTRLDLRLLTIT